MNSDKKYVYNSVEKLILIFIIISLSINVILYGNILRRKNKYKIWMKNSQIELDELNSKINIDDSKLEEILDKRYYEKLTKIVKEDSLVSFAKQQWNYRLTVNDKEFTENTMYIEENNINIALQEFRNEEKILPKDILNKGRVTGENTQDRLTSHIKVSSAIDYDFYEDEQLYIKALNYKYKNIPKGTVIELKLSDSLNERLNIGARIYGKENTLKIIFK